MHVFLLILSFAIILAGALLFTNAIEWTGHKLEMGQGAVGSLLAAVGTAMPETLIPIVAIIGAKKGSSDVAVGAIVGAPFLLGTIAMALVGIAAMSYAGRRPQGHDLAVHAPTLDRDLLFFMVFFAVALLLGLGAPTWLQIVAAVIFLIGYAFYVRQTLRRGGEVQSDESLSPLIMDRRGERDSSDPPVPIILLQLLIGLGCMVGGAHLFVEELVSLADSLGTPAIVLSLILAPLATELPEKANSFFWVRDGKDALALGNITGAMVFQATIPVFFGLAFTSWHLDHYAISSMILGLAGGAVAYVALRIKGRFTALSVGIWIALYLAFLLVVILS